MHIFSKQAGTMVYTLVNNFIKYPIAVKTWQRVFENELPKNINLNGITGFCMRRALGEDKRSQLFIRTDKNAAKGTFLFSAPWFVK